MVKLCLYCQDYLHKEEQDSMVKSNPHVEWVFCLTGDKMRFDEYGVVWIGNMMQERCEE